MKDPFFNNSEKILIRKACEAYIYYFERSTFDTMTEKTKKEMKERKITRKLLDRATKKGLKALNAIYEDPEILMYYQHDFISWFVRGPLRQIPTMDDMPEMEKIILKINRTLKQNKPKRKK